MPNQVNGSAPNGAANAVNGSHLPTTADLLKRIAELEQQVATTKATGGKVHFKIGEKGGVSVYGLGRFPTTMYASQWLMLLDDKVVVDLKGFIKEHWDKLSHEKPKKAAAANGQVAAAPVIAAAVVEQAAQVATNGDTTPLQPISPSEPSESPENPVEAPKTPETAIEPTEAELEALTAPAI